MPYMLNPDVKLSLVLRVTFHSLLHFPKLLKIKIISFIDLNKTYLG